MSASDCISNSKSGLCHAHRHTHTLVFTYVYMSLYWAWGQSGNAAQRKAV